MRFFGVMNGPKVRYFGDKKDGFGKIAAKSKSDRLAV
jgi:hypothetical protein